MTGHKKKRRGFHYDYREVFLKSNVPQFIATLSGSIVVWNEFFLKATGLSERDAKQLTIFAIVQSTELSNLYKMVARAMESSMKSDSSGDGQASSMSGKLATAGSSSTKSTGDREAWPATTLKCISFPK